MEVQEIHKNASIDAHFAALEGLSRDLGRKPTAIEVATALAVAFGDVMGIAHMVGVPVDQLNALNAIANDHFKSTVATIVADGCAGRA